MDRRPRQRPGPRSGSGQPAGTAPGIDPPTAEIVERLDDRTIRVAGGGVGRRLGVGVPGAVIGSLLVTALALGAALGPSGLLSGIGHAGRDDAAAGSGEPAPSDELGDLGIGGAPNGSGGPDGGPDGADDRTPAEHPDATGEAAGSPAPSKAPEPEPTVKPTPRPTPKPTADPAKIGLEVWIAEGHPNGSWGSCDGLEFSAYKVIRSTDATVAWPKGDGDVLVAVVGPDGQRSFWDGDAPHGQKAFYRVFCVRSTDGGSVVVGASAVVGILVPGEASPPPAPVGLGFELDVTGEGIVLHWQACGSDAFVVYKIVRSTTSTDPSYLPWTDGTELLAAIGDPGVTGYTDGGVGSGMTVSYRVQALGTWNGQKIVLGQTDVITVTIP